MENLAEINRLLERLTDDAPLDEEAEEVRKEIERHLDAGEYATALSKAIDAAGKGVRLRKSLWDKLKHVATSAMKMVATEAVQTTFPKVQLSKTKRYFPKKGVEMLSANFEAILSHEGREFRASGTGYMEKAAGEAMLSGDTEVRSWRVDGEPVDSNLVPSYVAELVKDAVAGAIADELEKK